MEQIKTIQEFYDTVYKMKAGSFMPVSESVMIELASSYDHGPVITPDLSVIAKIKQILEPLKKDEKMRILNYLTDQEGSE